MLRGGLSVVGQSNGRHEVNEHGGEVQGVPPFAGAVVLGKRVVVVVEAFAQGKEGHEPIFHRGNVDIVGFPSPHVSSRVDQEGGVQGAHVPEERHGVGNGPGLVPQPARESSGQHEAAEDAQRDAVAILEHEKFVRT